MEDPALFTDSASHRKARGAFFTPQPIADYLADWAVENDPSAIVLDPSCGEAVFLEAASRRILAAGGDADGLVDQVFGVDLHQESVDRSRHLLKKSGFGGTFLTENFFALSPPGRLDTALPLMDAVIGNPPFIRFQKHIGQDRRRAQQAALEQGVRLSGLASSWAALLVHACAFLKPEGRLAMVLPAELLSVGYAEPVRNWLRRRFKAVHLVMFEDLQFEDATERVILVLARGTGGCNAFSLVPVQDAKDLPNIKMFGPMHLSVAPAEEGKWTDFLLPVEQRQIFDKVAKDHFVPLEKYGTPTLGTVTGSNEYFCLSEKTRQHFDIPESHLAKISPPGTRHLKGLSFTGHSWDLLRDAGEPVWLFFPDIDLPWNDLPLGVRRYIEEGERREIDEAYKCRIRDPWYRPPKVPAPDLFFTYMSHRYPRLIANRARASFLNSMHGLRLNGATPRIAGSALPLLMLNSVTMLGAEVFGRSYGGGVLKMEPREAAILPVPGPVALQNAWKQLEPERSRLDRSLRNGCWASVIKRVDTALLMDVLKLGEDQTRLLLEAAKELRENRMGKKEAEQSADFHV